jgi:hypothetical protein
MEKAAAESFASRLSDVPAVTGEAELREALAKIIEKHVGYFNGWTVTEETVERNCREAADEWLTGQASALEAARREALEEAAKVADEHICGREDCVCSFPVAEAIRALASRTAIAGE